MAQVLFRTGTKAQYTGLGTKDSSTLYFITDTHEIFKGETNYTDSVIIVTTFPSSDILQGKLYINSSTLECRIYVGSSWITINPGYVTSIDGSGSANDTKLATIGAIKTYVQTQVSAQESALADHEDVLATTSQAGHVTVDGTTIVSTSGKIGVGTIPQSKVTNLTTDLNAKAPKASPTFTGTVTLPAADPTANTQAAHKGYVDKQDEATLEAAKEYADSVIGANDAMVYKGTIGTGGTVTALPATHEVGWTYKVITAGTYAGEQCEIGDMIICNTQGTSANDSHWTVVQANIDGAVIGPDTAVANRVVVFDGTTGKLIKDSGYTIAKSVPSNAEFTDTTYDLTSTTSSANGSVQIKLTDSDAAEDAITIKGTGSTTVTTDSTGVITVNSTNTDTTYTLAGTASGNTATVTLTPSSGAPSTVKFVAGDNVAISLDEGNIKISVTDFLASNILMTGYTKASSATPVAGTDTVLSAIGKLEKQIDGKAATSHTHTSANVSAMTGYRIGTSAAAIAATDTLNAAIGKLEYGKAPKASPTFTGTVTSNGAIVAKSTLTVSGAVTLSTEPTSASHATTKNYVDTAISESISDALSWQTL